MDKDSEWGPARGNEWRTGDQIRVRSKADLLKVLNRFIKHGYPDYREGRCDRIVMRALARYWERDESLPPGDKYMGCAYMYYSPKWIAEAWEVIQSHDDYKDLRDEYEKELRWDFPTNLTSVEQTSGQQASTRALEIYSLKKIIPLICDEPWLEHEIDSYLNAESRMLHLCMDRWIDKVYRNGLSKVIDACDRSGMSGDFGKTRLLSLCSAGRIMFTFYPKSKKSEYGEGVTFIGEDAEKRGDRMGIQSCYVPLVDAMALVNEMIKHWPSDPKEQAQSFKADNEVSFA